jgi:hypothetical protein
MIDPKIILPLRDGAPAHEFIVAGHNDDFALEVDGETLVGRLDPERGPAQAIAVEAPLELVNGALKLTGDVGIPPEPATGRTYGRKDGDWQEALPIVEWNGEDEKWPVIGGVGLEAKGWLWGTTEIGTDGSVSGWDLHAGGTIFANNPDGGIQAAGAISGNPINSNGDMWAVGTMSGHQVLSREWGSMGGIGLQTPIGGVHRYAFHWNGNAYIMVDNSTGWLLLTNQCDERLKQDIAPTRFDCLAALGKIPLFEFRWRDNSDPGDIKSVASTPETLIPIGLVAQRVEEVAPSLIVKPPAPTALSDAPFNPMQIDVNTMFAVLIGAIQQLTARVEKYEAEVERASARRDPRQTSILP